MKQKFGNLIIDPAEIRFVNLGEPARGKSAYVQCHDGTIVTVPLATANEIVNSLLGVVPAQQAKPEPPPAKPPNPDCPRYYRYYRHGSRLYRVLDSWSLPGYYNRVQRAWEGSGVFRNEADIVALVGSLVPTERITSEEAEAVVNA